MSLFCLTQRKIFWRKFVTRLFWGTIGAQLVPQNCPHSSEYRPLCSAEQINAYRFGTTWGWVNTYWQTDKKCIALMHCKLLWIKASAKCVNVNVNDDRIFIFGWPIPLRHLFCRVNVTWNSWSIWAWTQTWTQTAIRNEIRLGLWHFGHRFFSEQTNSHHG